MLFPNTGTKDSPREVPAREEPAAAGLRTTILLPLSPRASEPPELRENGFLSFTLPSLWSFTMAA